MGLNKRGGAKEKWAWSKVGRLWFRVGSWGLNIKEHGCDWMSWREQGLSGGREWLMAAAFMSRRAGFSNGAGLNCK